MIPDKALGAFVGLAVGDALGTTLEFTARDAYPHITDMVGGGPFNLNPGEWTDDTSMAIALAEALLSHGVDPQQILLNFCKWYRDGEFSHNGRCFDIGNTTRIALEDFEFSGQIQADWSRHSSGNGGIMRLAPAVLFARSEEQAIDYAVLQSFTTHSSNECLSIAELLAKSLWRFMTGQEEPHRFTLDRQHVSSSGYVVDTWIAAKWALSASNTFEEALLRAVNLGGDADTVGAVTGQMAGAYYGHKGIPQHWLDKLVWRERIEDLALKLIAKKY